MLSLLIDLLIGTMIITLLSFSMLMVVVWETRETGFGGIIRNNAGY